MLFTIGYEGAAQRDLIETLRAEGVARLIDVRALPLSRKPGFSKRVLAASVEAAGIAYTHLRALGTPKPGRDAARRGDVATLARVYGAHLATPEAEAALAEAHTLAASGASCLLCFEADPVCCHRSIVAERLGLPVRHLRCHTLA